MGTQVHWWMVLRCFLSAGEVAGDDDKDSSFYYCIKVHALNPHCRFQVLHLKTRVLHFQIPCVCHPSMTLGAILTLFLMLLHTGSLRFALHLSVVFTQLNDASQSCQHFKSRIESQPSFFPPPDLPLSLLVIQHLLYHTNSSVITVQRSAKRAAGRSKWAFIANAVVCNGDAALVGCSMYTLSSPVVKTELTLREADVGIARVLLRPCTVDITGRDESATNQFS